MPYDTKADFAAMYSAPLTDPDTMHRYANFRDPDFYGGQVINIRLHYHRIQKYPDKERLADRLISHSGITLDDTVILVGGAFGWTGEWIESKTGAKVVCVDVSTWVNADQANSGDDELQEAIEAGGLSISSGPGQGIYNKFSDPGPRTRISGGVVNERMDNNGSRRRVIAKLPKDPTLIITEEMWQLLTDQERTDYAGRLQNFGTPVVHVIDSQVIDGP